jgi:hypothetical protein
MNYYFNSNEFDILLRQQDCIKYHSFFHYCVEAQHYDYKLEKIVKKYH